MAYLGNIILEFNFNNIIMYIFSKLSIYNINFIDYLSNIFDRIFSM